MSTLAPPTTAKVILKTTKGPLIIEIWAKETPLLSKSFIQNCINKKYIGKSFNKIRKDMLIQTEPLDKSKSYKNEFNSRLRFNQRGLIGALKSEGNSSSVDSFFVTLKEIPEFNNDYVLFGKIVDDSIYNILKITEGELIDETPIYPVKITDIEVIIKYFDEIQEEEKPSDSAETVEKKKIKKTKPKVKLSFGDEDDNEEEEVNFKMRSAHEILHDKKLLNKVNELEHKNDEKEIKAGTKDHVIIEQSSDITDIVNDPVENKSGEIQSKNEIKLKSEQQQEIPKPSEKTEIKSNTNKTPKKTKTKHIKRDPIIDSDYDSNLDLSDTDDVEMFKIQEHKFVCR